MSLKKLFTMLTVAVTVFFLLSAMGEAASPINWQVADFTGSSEAKVDGKAPVYNEHSVSGVLPSFDVYSNAADFGPPYQRAQAYSKLNGLNMYLKACSYCAGTQGQGAYGHAYAGFYGEFVAEASLPYLFSYDYDYGIAAKGFANDASASNHVSASLKVYDVTTGSYIYDQMLLDESVSVNGINTDTKSGSDASVLSFNVPLGHTVQVWLDTNYRAETLGSSCAGNNSCSSDAHLSFNYNMTVAPEPISSILFIAGGATLVARRFWKKRQSA